MMFSWLSCIAVFLAVPTLSQTIIMGHHVGESASQFLAVEPGLQSRIDGCRASQPKPMTPEEIHALSKHDVESLGAQVFQNVLSSPDTRFQLKLKRNPNRGELEDLARQGMPIFIDKRIPDVIETCHALLLLAQSTTTGSIAIHSLPNSRPRPVTWHFTKGVLNQIDIDFHGGNFSEIANDFSKKTGVPPSDNKEIDTPNMYGATIHVSRKASWLTHELYVLLESEEGGLDTQVNAFVMSRAAYDEWAKTHAIKSTLD